MGCYHTKEIGSFIGYHPTMSYATPSCSEPSCDSQPSCCLQRRRYRINKGGYKSDDYKGFMAPSRKERLLITLNTLQIPKFRKVQMSCGNSASGFESFASSVSSFGGSVNSLDKMLEDSDILYWKQETEHYSALEYDTRFSATTEKPLELNQQRDPEISAEVRSGADYKEGDEPSLSQLQLLWYLTKAKKTTERATKKDLLKKLENGFSRERRLLGHESSKVCGILIDHEAINFLISCLSEYRNCYSTSNTILALLCHLTKSANICKLLHQCKILDVTAESSLFLNYKKIGNCSAAEADSMKRFYLLFWIFFNSMAGKIPDKIVFDEEKVLDSMASCLISMFKSITAHPKPPAYTHLLFQSLRNLFFFSEPRNLKNSDAVNTHKSTADMFVGDSPLLCLLLEVLSGMLSGLGTWEEVKYSLSSTIGDIFGLIYNKWEKLSTTNKLSVKKILEDSYKKNPEMLTALEAHDKVKLLKKNTEIIQQAGSTEEIPSNEVASKQDIPGDNKTEKYMHYVASTEYPVMNKLPAKKQIGILQKSPPGVGKDEEMPFFPLEKKKFNVSGGTEANHDNGPWFADYCKHLDADEEKGPFIRMPTLHPLHLLPLHLIPLHLLRRPSPQPARLLPLHPPEETCIFNSNFFESGAYFMGDPLNTTLSNQYQSIAAVEGGSGSFCAGDCVRSQPLAKINEDGHITEHDHPISFLSMKESFPLETFPNEYAMANRCEVALETPASPPIKWGFIGVKRIPPISGFASIWRNFMMSKTWDLSCRDSVTPSSQVKSRPRSFTQKSKDGISSPIAKGWADLESLENSEFKELKQEFPTIFTHDSSIKDTKHSKAPASLEKARKASNAVNPAKNMMLLSRQFQEANSQEAQAVTQSSTTLYSTQVDTSLEYDKAYSPDERNVTLLAEVGNLTYPESKTERNDLPDSNPAVQTESGAGLSKAAFPSASPVDGALNAARNTDSENRGHNNKAVQEKDSACSAGVRLGSFGADMNSLIGTEERNRQINATPDIASAGQVEELLSPIEDEGNTGRGDFEVIQESPLENIDSPEANTLRSSHVYSHCMKKYKNAYGTEDNLSSQLTETISQKHPCKRQLPQVPAFIGPDISESPVVLCRESCSRKRLSLHLQTPSLNPRSISPPSDLSTHNTKSFDPFTQWTKKSPAVNEKAPGSQETIDKAENELQKVSSPQLGPKSLKRRKGVRSRGNWSARYTKLQSEGALNSTESGNKKNCLYKHHSAENFPASSFSKDWMIRRNQFRGPLEENALLGPGIDMNLGEY